MSSTDPMFPQPGQQPASQHQVPQQHTPQYAHQQPQAQQWLAPHPPAFQAPPYGVPAAQALNIPVLVCLIVLGLHALVILVAPLLYRLTGSDGYRAVSTSVAILAILFAISLIVLGAIGARRIDAPRLRWAAIGGLVTGSFDLVVQIGSHLGNLIAYGPFHF